MSTKRTRKLKIETSGTSNFIQVASNRGGALQAFLRAHFIPSGPPQPFTSDNDSIQLGKGLDLKAVQALLNQWS